jgi:hypothetical protein
MVRKVHETAKQAVMRRLTTNYKTSAARKRKHGTRKK